MLAEVQQSSDVTYRIYDYNRPGMDGKPRELHVMDLSEPFHRDLLKYDSFVISICMEGDCNIYIRSTNDEIELKQGWGTLIPAAIADYDVIPRNGTAKLLDAFIDNKDRSLAHKVTRFLHITKL